MSFFLSKWNKLQSFKDYCKDFLYWQKLSLKIAFKNNEWMVLCPYGIGDTYFVCSLADEFLKRNGGDRFSVVVKSCHQDIPKLFEKHISRVITLDYHNTRAIKRFNKFQPGSMIIGHPEFYMNGQLLKQMGYKGITLLDLYKIIFGLTLDTPVLSPQVDECSFEKAEQKIKLMNLPIGKTVILAPQSNALNPVDFNFWVKLAKILEIRGWKVCTNTVKAENCIPGTVPLTFSLLEAIPLVELAGWIIASRSGLCDLIGSANVKMTVLYKDQINSYNSCSMLDMYSLKKIGFDNPKIYEYQYSFNIYDDKKNDNFIEKIIKEQGS
ncbi:hypothetical protein PMG71_01605 [Roseofilum sp. BLCC_M154]|uniref:ADP-heptose:LPS heptosyltransferase n=1 Tax=Roseofilum acuticapitatum BLCC-M154 TaxID=3022444 RepID=A0ABT7AMJ7_9CYAN|nr:hypothetical protein [Roseofilum acuticapitatum]MDJ1168119.1 hypothetical protein [Roseofilum acuticapitatum BLCC-M154]